MLREPSRWETHFGAWVCSVGVSNLAGMMEAAGQPVTPFAIHKWVAGERVPRHDRVVAMVELSAGQLSMADVYAQRELARRAGG